MIFDEFSAWEKLYGQKHGLSAIDVPHLRYAYQERINAAWESMALRMGGAA